MNVKKIAALSLVALVVGFSSAKADPWGNGRGWGRPHVAVEFRIAAPRIFVPPVPVVVEGTSYGRRPHRCVEYRRENCKNGYNQGYYNNGYNQQTDNCSNGYNGYSSNNSYYG